MWKSADYQALPNAGLQQSLSIVGGGLWVIGCNENLSGSGMLLSRTLNVNLKGVSFVLVVQCGLF